MSARLFKSLGARPFLLGAAALGLAAYLFLPQRLWVPTRMILAWDLFLLAYLTAIGTVMLRSQLEDIKRRAAIYDAGASTILLLSVGAAIASMVTVVVEMASATGANSYGPWQIALTIATVALSWVFVHVIFALHYAHDFYTGQTGAMLDFPGEDRPLYGDFLYFSFVIGCACATADVDIRSRSMRRLALLHGILSFFFNTAIVALSINIAASLIGGK